MVIQTNINSLVGLSTSRKINFNISNSLEKLSSGYRINKAADDPSGLAISTVKTAQIGGMDVAVQNAQDGINLIQTADGALAEMLAMAQRMRDLAVRGANQATLTLSDTYRLAAEYHTLWNELSRSVQAITFNTKQIFTGSYAASPGFPPFVPPVPGQALQVGPDASSQYQVFVTISSFSAPILVPEMGPGRFVVIANHDQVPLETRINAPTMDVAVQEAQEAIWETQAMLNHMSNVRARLGVQQRRLNHIVNDLDAARINISASRSRILDADMAREISGFTRQQILQQSTTAILAQANAQPQSVLQLLQ